MATVSERTAVPARRRLPAEQRRKQIVSVAHALMVEQGYGAVSLRAVASGCDVSLAAIQYFFPNKEALFTAMIDGVTSRYDAIYAELSARTDAAPRLEEFLHFILFDEINDRETAGFFYELWSLAHREPIASSALAKLYDDQLNRLTELVKGVDGAVDDEEAERRAAVIMAATDGLMMTIGYGKQPRAALRGPGRQRLLQLLMDLAAHSAVG